MPGPNLPENVASGGTGHVTHHNSIHDVVNRLDTTASPVVGHALRWDGSVYAPQAIPESGGGSMGWIDVKADFNAAGNNSNDDTAEIQAALSASAPGDTIYFPKGVYRISSGLTVGQGRAIIGSGTGMTHGESPEVGAVLLATANSFTMLTISQGTVSHNGAYIERMGFSGRLSPTARTVNGLEIRLINRWKVTDCGFRDLNDAFESDSDAAAWGGGTTGGDAAWGVIEHCNFRENDRDIWVPYSGAPQTVTGCCFVGANVCSIDISGGYQTTIFGNKWDAGPLNIRTKAAATRIIGNGFEDATSAFIELRGDGAHADSGRGFRVLHNTFARAVGIPVVRIDASLNSGTRPLIDDNYVSGSSGGVVDNSGLGYREYLDAIV